MKNLTTSLGLSYLITQKSQLRRQNFLLSKNSKHVLDHPKKRVPDCFYSCLATVT